MASTSFHDRFTSKINAQIKITQHTAVVAGRELTDMERGTLIGLNVALKSYYKSLEQESESDIVALETLLNKRK